MAAPRRLVIVTPALADANNGNWQTAQRWARMLSKAYRVRIAAAWDGAGADDDVLVALHARRSAASIAAFRAARPGAPVVVVLTGTDLYRDIDDDPAAQASLDIADRLVVLNALGVERLPRMHRAKADVVVQSCATRATLDKSPRRLRAIAVGHLRAEKAPRTLFGAVARLASRDDVFVDHVGGALDVALGGEARALAAACPRYRWLGARAHAETRTRIQRAHVLVHPSSIEGGAHAVIEAVSSGTPVLASRIDGNVGLLGADYAGYFPAGDDEALAALLARARDEPAMLALLARQCAAVAPAFAPAREQAAIAAVIARATDDARARPRPRAPTIHEPEGP